MSGCSDNPSFRRGNGPSSPVRAGVAQVALLGDCTAFKRARFENHGVPDALVTPDDATGEEERDRLETQWNQTFRRGGSGRAAARRARKVRAVAAEHGRPGAGREGATKELIANAFHCPIAFFTTQTNLANLSASKSQHMAQAVGPRLERRDEKLNAQLVPLYDPSGRLFLASEDAAKVSYYCPIFVAVLGSINSIASTMSFRLSCSSSLSSCSSRAGAASAAAGPIRASVMTASRRTAGS